jgi:hypothetical protein
MVDITFAATARGLTTSANTLILKSPIRRQPLRGFRASGGHVVAGMISTRQRMIELSARVDHPLLQ